MVFDYSGYLAILEEFHRPINEWPGRDARLAVWSWPPLKSYNGFSGNQRVWVWQLQRWAVDRKILIRPQCCEICAGHSRVNFHNETYADPWNVIGLCHACHMSVHGRFRSPAAWERFQALHRRSGKVQWFDVLPPAPIDLAGWLLRQGVSSAEQA